jgi:hypothetical protein
MKSTEERRSQLQKFRAKIQYVMDIEAVSMAQAVVDAAAYLPQEAFSVTAECYIPKEKPAVIGEHKPAESVAA